MSLPEGVHDPNDLVEKGHTSDEFGAIRADGQDYIEWQIALLEPPADRLRLPDLLRPIMEDLAGLDTAKAEAYLRYRVGPRFGLKERELGAYRSALGQLRKERREKAKAEAAKAETQAKPGADDPVEMGPDTDPAIIEKANEILRNPAILYLAGTMIQRLGVAGESTNIRLLYIIVTSRTLARPISATLKGESSVGKSYVVETVLLTFPPSAYIAMTGMSRQALIYRDESFSHKTIVIFERPGMDAADYNIRTLQSEGKLVFEVVEKNPETDRHETRRVEKEGPTNFIFTTTSPELHAENETWHWSLLMDESAEQTLAAKLVTGRRYQEAGTVTEDELAAWREVQTQLEPLKVRIPYAEWLAKHTPNRPIRMRRDFPRLLSLIEVVALLHQKQRHIGDDGVLVAGLSDYFMARELADQVFPAALSRINKKVEGLVHEVEKLYKDKRSKGEADAVVKSAEIAAALDVSASSVSRWLRPAVDVGLVEVVSETSKGYIRAVKPGSAVPRVSSALPTVEELAEAFPELARGFRAVHPITGEELTLEEEKVEARVSET